MVREGNFENFHMHSMWVFSAKFHFARIIVCANVHTTRRVTWLAVVS